MNEDSIQLIIPTRVTISGINITNEANVTSTTPDPNPNNNYDNEQTSQVRVRRW